MEHIDQLSKRYKFSSGIINHLKKVYKSELRIALDSMKIPGDKYYFRINTLKTAHDKVIKSMRKDGLEILENKYIEDCLYLPIKGPFNIKYPSKKIIVDKCTAESVMIGANVYAPGIVKCSGIRLNDKLTVVDPYDQPVATGIARMSEKEILSLRRGLAVETKSSIYSSPKLRETEYFTEGLIYLQSLPSILTGNILDPKPKEVIVDMTCSPGGKLSHLSQLMNNDGEIIGIDRNEKKISITRNTLNRLGCKNVKLLVQDSRYFHLDFPKIKADKCVVDPPCSALGILPKLYDFSDEEKILALAKYQRQFLKAASEIVRKGGSILYSVCTITLEECERIVKFAQSYNLEIEEQNLYLGSHGIKLNKNDSNNEFLQRFHPHKHGVGYFIACFKKI